MGSCVSVHRGSESAMKLRLSHGSKPDKLAIPPSPVKDKLVNGDRPINDSPVKSHWSPARSTAAATNFRDYGSREEAFFDTRPWLDSDCEDDFHSVNGDFTPSRGNTPVHQSLSLGSSGINKTPFENRSHGFIPSPSPTDKKKKLLELFQESFRDTEDAGNETMANGQMEAKATTPTHPPKSVDGTPSVPAADFAPGSERTMDGDVPTDKQKTIRSTQCCLPSLISHRSSSQRKKMSPAIAVIDNA